MTATAPAGHPAHDEFVTGLGSFGSRRAAALVGIVAGVLVVAGVVGYFLLRSSPNSTPVGRTGAAGAKHPQCYAYIEPMRSRSAASIEATAAALKPSPCHGDSWIFRWSQLEPSPGTYDWTLIDTALAASKPKPVFLRVIAGTQSPAWFPRADEIYVPNEGEGTSGWMPVPWNPAFLTDWGQFIAAYGARYDGNPQISIIEGGGDGPEGEANLSGTYTQWAAVGYTVPLYVNTIATLIHDFKTAFPHERISFAGASGPSRPPAGTGSPGRQAFSGTPRPHTSRFSSTD